MTNSAGSLPKSLRIGSTLVILAGAVPIVVASILYVAFLRSAADPSQPWQAGQFPPGPSSYSLNDIRSFNASLAVDFVTAQHIELANAINNAFLIVALAILGLRRYQKWSWYATLLTFVWLGINDAWAMISAGQPPVPLIPISVGVLGLLIARPAIFSRQ